MGHLYTTADRMLQHNDITLLGRCYACSLLLDYVYLTRKRGVMLFLGGKNRSCVIAILNCERIKYPL